jgi:hypothetical protein
MSLVQLFCSKVRIAGLDECWEWQGSKGSAGHGHFGTGRNHGVSGLAHRFSYILLKGKPSGLVCHSCNNPSCVNPSHLYDGTPQSNMDDKVRAGRASSFPGSSHPQAKLSEGQVEEILRSSLSSAQLARDYQVSPQAISRIRRGKAWKCVTKLV